MLKPKKITLALAALNLAAYGACFYLFVEIKNIDKVVSDRFIQIESEVKRNESVRSVKNLMNDTKKEREQITQLFIQPNGTVDFIETVESLGRMAGVKLEIESVGVESLKNKTALVTIGGKENKLRFAESVWKLKNLGFKLFATGHTHSFLKSKGVKTKRVYKVYEGKRPNVVDIISEKKVSLVINLSEKGDGNPVAAEGKTDGYLIRRAAIDNNIALFTDLNSSRLLVNALDRYNIKDLKIKSWEEYL